jgi:hypothetical protein
VVVATVLFGKKITGGQLASPLHAGSGAAVSHYRSTSVWYGDPGHAVFTCFVLYYFIN